MLGAMFNPGLAKAIKAPAILVIGSESYEEQWQDLFKETGVIRLMEGKQVTRSLDLEPYAIVIVTANASDPFKNPLGAIEHNLLEFVSRGGHLIFSAPVIPAFGNFHSFYPSLIPAVPYRETSQALNIANRIMVEEKHPLNHQIHRLKPDHPLTQGLSSLPLFTESARNSMYSSLLFHAWRIKPWTEVVLVTDTGAPALALQKTGAGSTMFLLHDCFHNPGFDGWADAAKFWSNAVAFLLEDEVRPVRHPDGRSAGFEPLKPLRPRPAFSFAPSGLQAAPDWKNILRRRDWRLLGDNQLVTGNIPSDYRKEWKLRNEEKDDLQEIIGIGPSKFYPPATFFDAPAELLFRDENKQPVALTFRADRYQWLPHLITSEFHNEDSTLIVQQKLTVAQDTIVAELSFNRTLIAELKGFSHCYAHLQQDRIGKSWWGQAENGIYFGLYCSEIDSYSLNEHPVSYSGTSAPCTKLTVAFTAALEQQLVEQRLQKAALGAEPFFAAAEAKWNQYFTEVVPAFKSDDSLMERLYYTGFTCYYMNLYDIPYEPWLDPYTCPTKTHFHAHWEQDDLPAAALGKWLNDKSLSIRQLDAPYHTGVLLNANATLEAMDGNKLGPFLGELQLFSLAQSDVYNMVRTEELRADLIRNLLSDEELNDRNTEVDTRTGLYINYNCLGMDNSPRWDFVMGGKRTEWFETFEQGVLSPDFNSTIAYRKLLLSQLLGENGELERSVRYKQEAEKLFQSINEHLWHKGVGFFVDAARESGEFSLVKTPYGFLPLLGCEIQEDAARELKERFWSKQEFHTPYMLPTVSQDHPAFDPESYWRGSIWGRTNWLAHEALLTAGLEKEAAYLTDNYINLLKLDGVDARENYNPLTGDKKCAEVFTEGLGPAIDMWIKEVAGFRATTDGFRLKPYALRSDTPDFTFGPFLYRRQQIKLEWNRQERRYTVSVNAKRHEYLLPAAEGIFEEFNAEFQV